MFSNKPYLVRAFYDWIVDNACTPYIVINARYPRCKVPEDHVENGEITLNISATAVRDFKITNEAVEFRASFSGVVHIIYAPIKSVLAIYAQENQQGMFFDYEEMDDDALTEEELTALATSAHQEEGEGSGSKGRVSHLKLVE